VAFASYDNLVQAHVNLIANRNVVARPDPDPEPQAPDEEPPDASSHQPPAAEMSVDEYFPDEEPPEDEALPIQQLVEMRLEAPLEDAEPEAVAAMPSLPEAGAAMPSLPEAGAAMPLGRSDYEEDRIALQLAIDESQGEANRLENVHFNLVEAAGHDDGGGDDAEACLERRR